MAPYIKLGKGMYVYTRKGIGLEAKKHALKTRIHNSHTSRFNKKTGQIHATGVFSLDTKWETRKHDFR